MSATEAKVAHERTDVQAHNDDFDQARLVAKSIRIFPFKGVPFFDIGGLLADVDNLQSCIDLLAANFIGGHFDAIGGFEARGFLFGPSVALKLGLPFFMLRKAGKMPNAVTGESYGKEYAGDDENMEDQLAIQRGAVNKGDKIILLDDVLATGGTLSAGCSLAKLMGAVEIECVCVIEIKGLQGRVKVLQDHPDVKVHSLITEDMIQMEDK